MCCPHRLAIGSYVPPLPPGTVVFRGTGPVPNFARDAIVAKEVPVGHGEQLFWAIAGEVTQCRVHPQETPEALGFQAGNSGSDRVMLERQTEPLLARLELGCALPEFLGGTVEQGFHVVELADGLNPKFADSGHLFYAVFQQQVFHLGARPARDQQTVLRLL